jgi:two-component system sensor histidine kinase YesM
MRLQVELNLIYGGILIVMAVSTFTVGIVALNRILDRSVDRLMALEMDAIIRDIDDAQESFNERQVAGEQTDIDVAQREVATSLQTYAYNDVGELFVVSRDTMQNLRTAIRAPFTSRRIPGNTGFFQFRVSNETFLAHYQTYQPWEWVVVLALPEREIYAERAAYTAAFITVSFAAVVIAALLSLSLSRRIAGSLASTVACIHDFQTGKTDVHLDFTAKTRELVQLKSGINTMFNRINERTTELLASKEERLYIQRRLYEEELRHKEAAISALQGQINPHFLYNTLECVNSIAVLENVAEIQEIAIGLSHLFKYAIKGSKFVPVSDELTSIERYMRIQNIRFLDKFTLEIEVPDDLQEYRMLKFILQPLVENSVYHGLEPKIGPGRIIISANQTGPVLEFTVSDNGMGMSAPAQDTLNASFEKGSLINLGEDQGDRSIGLINIHERIRLVYGDGYGLHAISEEGVGTTVSVRMPVI